MRPILYYPCAVVAAGLIGGMGTAASAAPMISATSGAAVGNANPDPTDVFNGAAIDSSYAAVNGSFYATDMFGTSASAESGHMIFADNGGVVTGATNTQANVTFVNFHTAAPVTIGGYNLYLQGDPGVGGAGHREATFVRLYASNDGGATYGIALSAAQINPILDFSNLPDPKPDSNYETLYGSNKITVSDTFATPATYQYYRVELMTDPWASPNGIRVIELDATPVPEPASMGLIGLGLMGLLHRRRR